MSTTRVVLSGADVVLPDRVATSLTVVLEGDRIVDLLSGPREVGAGETRVDLTGHLIVPGFIDVHVHGVCGVDVLDGADAVRAVARALPRYGVTAFCPTTVACSTEALSAFLRQVSEARSVINTGAARVLPAHLETPFINPDFGGAQPREALRPWSSVDAQTRAAYLSPDVGILTLAPEMPGGFDLLRDARAAGIRVSVGHTGASFDQAMEAIDAGACHATHLFNRMTPMTHRDPGVVGAVLARDEVAAEIIGDGAHVHPAVVRVVMAAKGPQRVMAITDGTAGSGLPRGACARLGGRRITVADTALLDDGTLAGSVATMDRVFATLVTRAGQSLVDAAMVCATTPARELGLVRHGAIVAGHVADLTVLTSSLTVAQTWIGGVRTSPQVSA